MAERRRLKRTPVRQCYIECSEDSFWNFLRRAPTETFPMIDISEGGCQFLATGGMPLGQPLRLHLIVPKEPTPVTCKGEVVWSHVGAKKVQGKLFFSVGIRFTRFPKDQRNRFGLLMKTGHFQRAAVPAGTLPAPAPAGRRPE